MDLQVKLPLAGAECMGIDSPMAQAYELRPICGLVENAI